MKYKEMNSTQKKIRMAMIGVGLLILVLLSGGMFEDVPADRYVLPIPKREIDITKGSLEQNPGYL